MAAGDLSEHFAIPPATMSFHLKELSNAGLIIPRREEPVDYILCKLRSDAGIDGLLARKVVALITEASANEKVSRSRGCG